MDDVSSDETAEPKTADSQGGGPVNSTGDLPPEKVEAVLNSGMQFIGGLLEITTGKKMEAAGDDGRMVHIDKTTGEVTLKFKLPGF